VVPIILSTAVAIAGCSKGSSWHDGTAGGPASKTSTATVTTKPDDGAAGVSVLDPISVAVKGATLDSVSLTNPEGKPVAGELSQDKLTWRSTESLGYDKRYELAVAGTDTKGVKISKTSGFTTVKPANLTLPYLQANAALLLESRKVFGVGQPIVVRFDEKIPDRAAAEKALVVTTEPQVEGVWHWFTDQEVHWRPEEYWKPGTQVTVTAKVYGLNLGSGLYGQKDVSASFAIGDKKVAIADDSTLRISVYVNDQLTRTVATSMGKHATEKGKNGEDLDLRTRSGVHVVLGTDQKTRMTGASWGLANDYDKDINYTTHISYQGEYIHEATWNIPLHGRQHDSHGCLNVGTQDAQWFMNNFIPGDIVEVKNSGIALANMDGLTDWNLTWEQWREGSALS
jgi:lipoprotein-anchoring transpeptidase ErfK/SrfK